MQWLAHFLYISLEWRKWYPRKKLCLMLSSDADCFNRFLRGPVLRIWLCQLFHPSTTFLQINPSWQLLWKFCMVSREGPCGDFGKTTNLLCSDTKYGSCLDHYFDMWKVILKYNSVEWKLNFVFYIQGHQKMNVFHY